MAERALLIVNPAAGKRHAEDGDLAECVRLLTAAGFDIDRRETGTDGPTSADLAKTAIAEGFRVVLVAGGDGTVAPAAIALLETNVTLGILPFGSYMNIANGLGIPLKPIDAARVIAERKVKRSDVGEVAGKVFFETCGIGIDADMFGAARLAERGRALGVRVPTDRALGHRELASRRDHRRREDRKPPRSTDPDREQSLLRLGHADRAEREHDRRQARRGDLPAKREA